MYIDCQAREEAGQVEELATAMVAATGAADTA